MVIWNAFNSLPTWHRKMVLILSIMVMMLAAWPSEQAVATRVDDNGNELAIEQQVDEEALLTAPGVAEVAVVGAPDAEWGEVVVAFVVGLPGTTPDVAALDAHCLAQMARFKRPKRYVLVDALPKNHYGKVLKTELRQRV